MKNKFLQYIAIIISTTLFLYGVSIFLGNLDKQYFELHKTELTTSDTFILPDDLVVTNYFYANTPYHYFYIIISTFSLFFPIILVWVLSARLVLIERNSKTFLKSLCIPIVYGIINIMVFFTIMDKSLGWEYSVGKGILFTEIIFIFISVVIINGTILLKNKIKEHKIT